MQPNCDYHDKSDSVLLNDEDKLKFQRLVGLLNHLQRMTRPDISFVMSFLSSSLSSPYTSDLNHAKYVLRYISGTFDYGLFYKSSPL